LVVAVVNENISTSIITPCPLPIFSFKTKNLSIRNRRLKREIRNKYCVENGSAVLANPPAPLSTAQHLPHPKVKLLKISFCPGPLFQQSQSNIAHATILLKFLKNIPIQIK